MSTVVTTEELLATADRILKSIDPAACLVLPRVLRRVIKEDAALAGHLFEVPHRKTYHLSRDVLLRHVALDELGGEPPRADSIALIAYPDEPDLDGMSLPQLLLHTWRGLFHIRIHEALETRIANGALTLADVHRRIDRIGQTQFDEIRTVLRHENYLIQPDDFVSIYVEFCAVYWELKFFAPNCVRDYFPSLRNPESVEDLLVEDVPAAALFARTRLPGAPDPRDPSATLLDPQVRNLLKFADHASEHGNAVNAALLRNHAATVAPPLYAAVANQAAQSELDRLTERLQSALGFASAEAQEWRDILAILLANSRRGFWNSDKRLLYDLQNVCVDFERETSALDLAGWVLSLGKRPLRRRLPHQRDVRISRHLRSAQARIRQVQLSGSDRDRLARLLRGAAKTAAERIRNRFRSVVAQTLTDVGLIPQNLPERVARNKVVEELLDIVVERGYLTIGLLRDALSRNNLKFDDLLTSVTAPVTLADPPERVPLPTRKVISAGFITWSFRGYRPDPLLRADAQLSERLDGVYRRSDFYLRWLQTGSALAFGTPEGRFLTKYVVLPLGGAFVILEFLNHLIHLVAHQLFDTAHPPELLNYYSFGGLAAFLFAMLHISPFRRFVVQHLLLSVWHLIKGVAYDFPVWLLKIPAFRRFLFSAPVMIVRRWAIWPLLLSGVFWLIVRLTTHALPSFAWFAGVYLLFAALLNSRIGRDVEEVSREWVGRTWYHIRVRILVALYELILDSFKWVLERIERVLYAVDEFLRFRSGESSLTFFAKAVLGMVWSWVTFVVRFAINLLVEPQINPIKHFPVVTVSHKIILPTQPIVAGLLVPALGGVLGNLVAVTIITSIPGIFGFLVWELKENWRLYRANRRANLAPVLIGSHGETMIRLMKPGLHSGTLPRLFGKLRVAQRKAHVYSQRVAITQHHERLHHVEESLRHFFEREFVDLLMESEAWGGVPVHVGEMELASNSVKIEFPCPSLGSHPLALTFEEQNGWLVVNVSEAGWVKSLSAVQRQSLAVALQGLYKLAGVDLVREQVERCFEPHQLPYDFREHGLTVWPDVEYQLEIHYHFQEQPVKARPRALARQYELPDLELRRLMYIEADIRWDDWVESWSNITSEIGPTEVVSEPTRVLPRPPIEETHDQLIEAASPRETA